MKLSKRKCKSCGEIFQKVRPLQSCCGIPCSIAHANKQKAKNILTEQALDRQLTRKKLNGMKGISELTKEAQIAFNAFIRGRDKGKLCICCDKPYGENNLGGSFDCGHWKSRGSSPHLRFNEDNAHGQRKYCNMWLGGRPIEYRLGLIKRIGIERVEALESNNAIHKWTKEELIAIKVKYKQLTKQMES